MSKFMRVFVIGFFLLSFNSVSKAQVEQVDSSNVISNYFLIQNMELYSASRYEILLDSVKKGLSDDYFALRMCYTNTNNWSPYSSDFDKYLDKVDVLIDSTKFNEALVLVDSLSDKQFVSLRLQLMLGYIYKNLNRETESEEHYAHYDRLIQSIYDSGDGFSPQNAFIVISTKETYAFLRAYRLQSKGNSLISEDGYMFDLMKTVDKNNEEMELYFNVTLPINYLNKKLNNSKGQE